MGLKPTRQIVKYDVSYFMNETATRGGCVVLSTAGSGDAMDQAEAVVTYAANPSGDIPVGILSCDVVDKNLSQTHLNFHKDEVQVNSKVTLIQIGDVETNMIYPGVTPAVNEWAYVAHSGYITNVAVNPVNNVKIGMFKSTKDEDGYCKVAVNLP